MRYLILIAGILLALALGFIYAGHIGALLFSIVILITVNYYKKREVNNSRLKTNLIILVLSFSLSYFAMDFFGLLGACKEVTAKLDLIKTELIANNYNPRWVIISQKRNSVFNNLLPNSAKAVNGKKGSYHLTAKAIDIYVFDINGDNIFDSKDILLLEKANQQVEIHHPELIGALGDYHSNKKGYLANHMIHIDVRGKPNRYSY